jgi:hypothetical protein
LCTSCVPVDLDLKKEFGQVPFSTTITDYYYTGL